MDGNMSQFRHAIENKVFIKNCARNARMYMKMQEIVVCMAIRRGRFHRGQNIIENTALIGIMAYRALVVCGTREFGGANHDGIDHEAWW